VGLVGLRGTSVVGIGAFSLFKGRGASSLSGSAGASGLSSSTGVSSSFGLTL